IFDEQRAIHNEKSNCFSTYGVQLQLLTSEGQAKVEFDQGKVEQQEVQEQYDKQREQYLKAANTSSQAKMRELKLIKYKYKTIDGGEAGPYTIEELRQYLEYGYLKPDLEVYNCFKTESQLELIGKIVESATGYGKRAADMSIALETHLAQVNALRQQGTQRDT
ncbi:hypothetical protein CYMTET_26188, partial [Cymbomonas tetramitiformis]